jgi:DNA helicase HerA-like ATPase
MLNRHGLVAGATGTGKTKTLQVMAEQLSAVGIPVFAADIKGDLSGIASPGEGTEKLLARAASMGQDWTPVGCPVELLALGGQGIGSTVRATVSSFGPTLLSKALDLNDTQESSLGLVFHFADKAGLPLLDLADLRAAIQFLISPEGKEALQGLGGLSKQTAGVILRELIAFADQGGEAFFGEPELDVADLFRVAPDGRGIVTLLELPQLQDRPLLFSTFLMWLLAELFEELPEVGDLERPKLVFFFDEAHLLFKDASKPFLAALTQTVRLIRSKGVGVFFVTQTPKDVHADVLAQLGSRVQHQLRAFTPDDEKALRATARTFPKSAYDLDELLTTLGIGQAVVTVQSEKGTPTPVAATMIRAPLSLMAPTPAEQVQQILRSSPLHGKYATAVDRASAREMLAEKLGGPVGQVPAGPGPAAPAPAPPPLPPPLPEPSGARRGGRTPAPAPEPSVLDQVVRSRAVEGFLRSFGSSIGREITRGIFGTGRRRRR